MARKLAAATALMAALCCASAASGSTLSTTPDRQGLVVTAGGTADRINAIAEAGPRTYIGGDFSFVGTQAGNAAVLGKAAGEVRRPTPTVAGGTVKAVVADGAGGWYLGGDFATVNGVDRPRLARLKADGTVDEAFNPRPDGEVRALALGGGTLYAGGAFAALNGTPRANLGALDPATGAVRSFDATVDGAVNALLLDGGRLYAGGAFANAGGAANGRLAALDPSTGADVGAFDGEVTGTVVNALAVGGGRLYAGGTFTQAQPGAAARQHAAAFDTATGDPTAWNPSLAANSTPTVTAIAVGGGEAFVGGTFERVNVGQAGETFRSGLAKVDATSGAHVPAFQPGISSTSGPPGRALLLDGGRLYVGSTGITVRNGTEHWALAAHDPATGEIIKAFGPSVDDAGISTGDVNALASDADDVFAGGNFDYVGAVRRHLAAVDPDGSVFYGFEPRIDDDVSAIGVTGGRVYAGGSFSNVNLNQPTATTRTGLAAFDPATGVVDAGFNAQLGNQVWAIEPDGTDLFIGGAFSTVQGAPRNGLAKVNGATGAPTAFTAGVDDGASDFEIAGSRVFAVGGFTTAANGAVQRNGAAAFDKTTGAVDAWDPAVAGGAFTSVDHIALSADTAYLTGNFERLNAGRATEAVRDDIAAVTLDSGEVRRAFDASASGALSLSAGGPVEFLDGRLYAVGDEWGVGEVWAVDRGLTELDPVTGRPGAFAAPGAETIAPSAGGLLVATNRLVRHPFAPDPPAPPAGVAATSLPALGFDGSVSALAATTERLYVGGSFQRMGPPSGGGARLNGSTGARENGVPTVHGTVHAAISDGAGGLYIGGSFERIGSTARRGLAHVLADGTVDPGFDPAVGGAVHALLLDGSTLYVGGAFRRVNVGLPTEDRRPFAAAFDAGTGVRKAWYPDPDGTVRDIAADGSNLFIAGDFRRVATHRSNVPWLGIAKVDKSGGEPLTAFDPRAVTSGAGAFVQSIRDIAVAGSRVYVAGGSSRTSTASGQRTALWAMDKASGTIETGFAPALPANSSSVTALEVDGSRLLIGGNFASAGGATRANAAAVALDTGTADPGFDPRVNGTVETFELAGGRVLMGGSFTRVNTTGANVAREGVAAVDPVTGAVDTAFAPPVFAGGRPLALAPMGGSLFVGGSYTLIDPSQVGSLVALNTDGTVHDPGFDADVGSGVTDLAVHDGKLFATGFFSTVNNGQATQRTQQRAAAFDLATGTVDAGFAPTVFTTSDFPRDMLAAGDRIYIGSTGNELVALDDTTGASAPGFAPGTIDADVLGLALDGNRLFLGGSFTSVGGTPRRKLAAVDAATGALDPWQGPLANNSNHVFAVLLDAGRLIAGGFVRFPGDGGSSPGLGAFDATTGAHLPGFRGRVNDNVDEFAVGGDRIYAAGDFTIADHNRHTGAGRAGLVALDRPTGAVDTFDPGLDGTGNVVLATPDRLYFGGAVTSARGEARGGLAVYSGAFGGPVPPSGTGGPTPTATPTSTGTPSASATATASSTPVATETATPAASSTPAPSATARPTATASPEPSGLTQAQLDALAAATAPKLAKCVKQRKLTMRVPPALAPLLQSVVATIAGKPRAFSGAALTRPIALGKLPKKGKYSVSYAFRAANGLSASVTRSYTACKVKKRKKRSGG